ncbi:MAG: response regulator, partial [Desulfatitalea sp.]
MLPHCLRILIAEDEMAHAHAIRRALEMDGTESELHVAGSLREYREMAVAHRPDVALVDLNLPDGSALEILTLPAEAGPFPVLIMTSFGDEHTAVEAMKAGALDYVVKSSDTFSAIPNTIKRALREWRLLQKRRQAENSLRENEAFTRDVLNSLPSHIAVLDDQGVIMAVNEAWEHFALENGGADLGVGANYLSVCDNVASEDREAMESREAAEGIRAVLQAQKAHFTQEYPCHSPDRQRWFVMRVTPLRGNRRGVVCAHVDITQRKLAEEGVQHLNRVLIAIRDINQLIVHEKKP